MPNWPLQSRRPALRSRALILQAIRNFFIERGYLEVETPFRMPAPAPEAHIDALQCGEGFPNTSPQLCIKRLLAAGYDRLFQICRCWRKGERGQKHLSEFTMLEWYRSLSDYRNLMTDCEDLLRWVAKAIGRESSVRVAGREISLLPDWERLSVRDAFTRYAGTTVDEALSENLFDELMVTAIEPMLGWSTPVLLHDYPAELGALARLSPDDPSVAERFELYIGGVELANGFSELTDAAEQRTRFAHEAAMRSAMGKTAYPVPEKFLLELPEMPPSAGIALGIDRLVMVFLEKTAIDDVVAFTPEEL